MVNELSSPTAQRRSAPSPDPVLSVVICAYTTERWDRLCGAVESVLAEDIALETIVVIDHCEQLLVDAARRFDGDDRIRVIANDEVRGLSGARNTGLRAALSDVVAFLDDDAVAQPGWAHDLCRHYQDPTVVGVGGYATPVWPDSRPGWMPAEFDWVVGCSYIGQPTRLAPVRNPIGCNMSLRRSVVDRIGGFRSEIGRVGTTPVGCEETELFIRLRSEHPSNRVLFDPLVRVEHYVTHDRTRLRYFVRRCYHEGISKAVVTELSGASAGLSSERSYVRKVLPAAVVRELTSMTSDGLARAAVICLGLAVTTFGYIRATVSRRVAGRRA
jgi:glycosyltransferase involved in cell wall biosynthesis